MKSRLFLNLTVSTINLSNIQKELMKIENYIENRNFHIILN